MSAQDLLKEVAIIFITFSMVWPQVKLQGGNTALPITRNWINDLLSMQVRKQQLELDMEQQTGSR